jgi:SAM-dependent methyltransferase
MTQTSPQTRSPHFAEDATARTYAEIHLPRIFAPWARVLLEVVPTHSGDVVLDVATGPGTVAREAARAAGPDGRVVGVDLSTAMLNVGRGWAPEPGAAPIEYVEASATSMPLPDATFDVGYCQQGLQHMSDPHAALRELRRLLKAGARLGVATWQRSPFGLFREIVERMTTEPNRAIQPSLFGRDAPELALALREMGFQDVEVQTRELNAVLEGGIDQALRVAPTTSAAASMRDLPPERERAIREAITEALQPYVREGAVVLPSIANIASARGA